MTPPSLSPDTSPTHPNVLAFLPILYMAWSDDMLTPTEVATVNQMIADQSWLGEEEKAYIMARLDPAAPPSVSEVKQWLRTIKAAAKEVPALEKRTLVDLSMQLANLGSEAHAGMFKNDSATKALHEIQDALGIISVEAAREMLAEARDSREQSGILDSQPSFDLNDLQALLDGDMAGFKNKVKTLLSDPAFSYDHIPQTKEAYREQVLTWLTYLAEQGYGALSYPTYAGGSDDMRKYFAVFEVLGHHDISLLIKYGVQFGLFGGSILGLGTKEQHIQYLPDTGTLALPGCFAMTESGHGSNVRDLETTATFDPETQEFVIHTPHDHAFKEYIGNAAAHARMATVFAQLITQGERHGVHAILVPIRDEEGNAMKGVRIGDSGRKLGLNGVDNGRLWFDQVRVPKANLLGRFASIDSDGTYHSPITNEGKRFFTMLGTLVGGRVGVPLGGLSAAKSGLSIAIQYANQRRQFGPKGEQEVTIMTYQTHQRRLLPLLAKTYAFHFGHVYMIDRFLDRQEGDEREVEALAAGLKALSTWHTTKTLQECREACGGNGYLWVNRFADLKADTDIFTTFEGDNTVLLQLVAKARLTEFRQAFSSMNFLGMVNFLAKQITNAVKEKNPIISRLRSEEHLRDSDLHLSLFRCREEELVISAAQRLRKRISEGMDSFYAMIEVQSHLVEVGKAYVERVILEQFVSTIQNLPSGENKDILLKLCDLYALHQIEEHLAWYLEQGYIESAKSKAIRKQVTQLCKELKSDAIWLVKAFGIPDPILGAPIARK
ncbi:MAG: acyl-CoA dehydrogenase [Bacteroidota bacterium]